MATLSQQHHGEAGIQEEDPNSGAHDCAKPVRMIQPHAIFLFGPTAASNRIIVVEIFVHQIVVDRAGREE
jgi:hypothetical protein